MTGKYAIELDGIKAGWVWSVEGGQAIADGKYEDITITCGTGMTKAFYQWMKDSFDHKHSRKSGAIISATFDHKEMSRMEFTNARIKEIRLPALDAGSKDALKMSITLEPESTHVAPAEAGMLPKEPAANRLSSKFRLQIDGLDCSRVNKIEALTVRQLESPNLVVTLAASHHDNWRENQIVDRNDKSNLRAASLAYLDQDRKNVLMELKFDMGIYKLTPDKVEAGGEGLKAEMYCENITFMYFDYKESWA
jgi:hypothetical protein